MSGHQVLLAPAAPATQCPQMPEPTITHTHTLTLGSVSKASIAALGTFQSPSCLCSRTSSRKLPSSVHRTKEVPRDPNEIPPPRAGHLVPSVAADGYQSRQGAANTRSEQQWPVFPQLWTAGAMEDARPIKGVLVRLPASLSAPRGGSLLSHHSPPGGTGDSAPLAPPSTAGRPASMLPFQVFIFIHFFVLKRKA